MLLSPPLQVGIQILVKNQEEANWYAERFSFLMRGEELPEYTKMRDHLGSVMTKYRELLAIPRTNYLSLDLNDPAIDQGDLKLSRAVYEAQSFVTPERLSEIIMKLIKTGDIFR